MHPSRNSDSNTISEKSEEPRTSMHEEKEIEPISELGSGDAINNRRDVDEAMKAFGDYQGQIIPIDEATNKRLLRRIDLHLMPV